jgi:hypothetical protein
MALRELSGIVALAVASTIIACAPAPHPIANRAPLANTDRRACRDAALGLERATRGVRAPDDAIAEAMRARCDADAWPTEAVDCFATMHEGDLARCAATLADKPRNAMFGVLGGGAGDRTKIVIAQARLEMLKVGVAECDRFVLEVLGVLRCEQMPIDARVDLGNQTADFWALPDHGLPPDVAQQMSQACASSRAQLAQQATGAGCR